MRAIEREWSTSSSAYLIGNESIEERTQLGRSHYDDGSPQQQPHLHARGPNHVDLGYLGRAAGFESLEQVDASVLQLPVICVRGEVCLDDL